MNRRISFLVIILAVLGGALYFVIGRGPGEGGEGGTVAADAADPAARRSARERDFEAVEVSAEGRVVRDADGKGVAGALVALWPDGKDRDAGADTPTAITDEQGGFRLDGLDAGKHVLSATASGYLPAVKSEITLGPGENGGLELRLEEGGSALRGTVSDITGGPIEAALVRVTPMIGVAGLGRRASFAAVSGEDGRYAVNVADGRYRVNVFHLDYGPAARTVEIRPGSREHDFQLTPAATIEGVVLTGEGTPVPDAKVLYAREQLVTIAPGERVRGGGERGGTESDEAGKFRIRGLQPGVVSLVASARGLASEAPVEVPVAMAEQVTGVQVFLAEAHVVRGRVVEKRDQNVGVSGARVLVGTGGEFHSGAVTGPEGDFELPGLLPGRYSLMAEGEGLLPQFPGTPIQVDGDMDDVEVVVDRGVAIRGRVEPPTTAEVSIDVRPEKLGMGGLGSVMMLTAGTSTASGEDGEFSLSPVRPGKIDLVARAGDGRVGEVEVDVPEEGAEDVVIRLEQRARVSGRVIDSHGDPVADASVSLKRRQTGSMKMTVIINGLDMGSTSAPTAEDGSFSILGVADGQYDMSVLDATRQPLAWASGAEGQAAAAPAPLEIAGGQSQDGLSLVVEAQKGVIKGTVQTAEGEPAPDVWVTATRAAEGGLPEPRREPKEGEGEVEHRAVMVMATDDGGGMGLGTSQPPVLTNEDGEFEIKGLRDGSYELVAEVAGGGARIVRDGVWPGQNVALKLAPLGTIAGRVTAGGAPVRDYFVRVAGPVNRSRRVRSSDGRFEIERLDPGSYGVTITAPSGGKTVQKQVAAGETANVEISIDEWVKVTGTVVDKQGQPIVGATVMIGEGEGGRVMIERDGSEEDYTTDDKGRFEARCAAGPRVLLVMGADGPMPLLVKFFVAESGKDVDLGRLEESPPRGMIATEESEQGQEPG